MKKANSVLAIKFKSTHEDKKMMKVCDEDLNLFRNVPGLIQKYYLIEQLTGAISGFYIFSTQSARASFLTSDLAKGIPVRYGVIPDTFRMEQYNLPIVLNEENHFNSLYC